MTPTLKRYSFQALGTYCEVQLYDESRVRAKQIIRTIAAEVQRLDNKYSRYRRDSLIGMINASAGDHTGIDLDAETRFLIDHAFSCYQQSDGMFDITAGILNRVWDFQSDLVPAESALQAILPFIGFDKLRWRNSRLVLPEGMSIDLGDILTQYAADSAANLARKLGAQHGLVNLGGVFSVIGARPDQQGWLIGVVNPNAPKSLMAKIDVTEGGLASSGDYEKCFVYQGKRYSHMLNPKTGWPCEGLRAVSVAASQATVAGTIAALAMFKEEDAGIAYLQKTGLPHVYMTQSETVAGVGLIT